MKPITLRHAAIALVVATISGCVPPPSGYAAPYQPYPPYQSAQNSYPPPANYPPPNYPPAPPTAAYAQGYPPPDAPVYPDDQYTYIDGVPYAIYGGQDEVVIFDPGLGWGFYDPYHHWHRAPDRWRGEFEHRFPGGRGYNPPPPREFGARPGFPPPGYPPPGRPPEGVRPGAFQPGPGRAPESERGPEPRGQEFRGPASRPPEPRVEERRPPERPGEPRGAEQHVNQPRPEAAPRPQAPPPPPQQRPAARGLPACGEPGAPRC